MFFGRSLAAVVVLMATTAGEAAFDTAAKLSLNALTAEFCTAIGVGPPSFTSSPPYANPRSTPFPNDLFRLQRLHPCQMMKDQMPQRTTHLIAHR